MFVTYWISGGRNVTLANNNIQLGDTPLQSAYGFIETLQTPRLRTGGASSSRVLNNFFQWVKRDILRLSVDVSDTTENMRRLALILAAQNAGLTNMYNSLSTQLATLSPNGSPNRAMADFFNNTLTVSDATVSNADISPLFGQVILPARSRQNILVIERPGNEPPSLPDQTSISLVSQPTVTSTAGATAPADFLFGEDPEFKFALDGNDLTAWIVEDVRTPHVAWVEIDLPGDVSGSYRCNELELVPAIPFNMSLFAIQVEVIGQGWQDLDFSYLNGYNNSVISVVGMGPSRLCFAQTSISRIRLGLWVAGLWGFNRIRVLNTAYVTSANITVDFSTFTSSTLLTTTLSGKSPSQLGYLSTVVNNRRITATLAPTASASETPVLTSIAATW